MPAVSNQTIAARVKRIQITIPGSASTAVTLRSLIEAGLTPADKHNVIGGRVGPTTADYVAGDSTSSLPLTITTPAQYTEPEANFLDATFVKASGAGTLTACVSVWLAGDGRLGL